MIRKLEKLLGAGLVAMSVFAMAHADNIQKPNILFILADDLGYADVGFTGGNQVKTPNLDRLAGNGVRLNQFYSQPVCTPTRAAMLTGRYPIRYGLQQDVIRPFSDYGLPVDERTLPEALKDAGYRTALVGKWHLGHVNRDYLPTRRGFDYQYGNYNGAMDYFTHKRGGGWDWFEDYESDTGHDLHRNDRAHYEEGYVTHLFTRETVRYIREHDGEKPFFIDLAYTAPHKPLQVPESYKQPYAHLGNADRIAYAGMVAALDEGIGEIVAALEEKGILDNTLIIFASDNGGTAPGKVSSNGQLRAGKGTLYEGGVRVAAFATWARQLKAGTVIDEPLHIVDWYPTLLKLAGSSLEQEKPIDGRDIWPTLVEGKPSPHDAILINADPDGGAIRMGDWKLVINGSDKPGMPVGMTDGKAVGDAPEKVELFNLANDPYEENNLADANPGKVKALRARYDALAAQAVEPLAGSEIPDAKTPRIWGETD